MKPVHYFTCCMFFYESVALKCILRYCPPHSMRHCPSAPPPPASPLQVVVILCMQLLLQFYTDSIEIFTGVYVIKINILFLSLFSQISLIVIFLAKMNRYQVSCVCNPLLQYYADSFETLGGTSFVDLLCFYCLVFATPLYASVYMCLVVTCWERADLLALVCGV